MFCSKCGKEIPEESTFCTRCGRKIESAPGVSNTMLILAGCAAMVSVSFGMLSFFQNHQMPSRTGLAATSPSATGGESPKVTPTPQPPTVEVTQAGGQSASVPVSAAPPESKRQTIVSESMLIQPRRFRSYQFVVKGEYSNAHITGYVSASGGGDDIYMMIVDDQGLREFSDRNGSSSYFKSKVLNSKNVNVGLAPGVYHVIFSNTHARFFAKQVEAKLFLEFD